MNLDAFMRAFNSSNVSPEQSWQPVFLQVEPGSVERFQSFCRDERLDVLDTISRQLDELAAIEYPSSSDIESRKNFVADKVAAEGGTTSFGNWVYLPWERKIAHLLGEDDYYTVITSRNQNKINPSEQRILRTKTIGVIGLSVGGEAAVSVAQEHLCGEVYLADFDALDLSNLNRLNTGFDELGTNKSIIAARRIVKIDPYMKVRIFPEGVNEANMASFLDPLDLLIEECDGLGLKYEIRKQAKQRGLNIVFAADERGFLSIEPHGHEPDFEIFHGLVTKPHLPREAYPTPLAFMQVLTEWLGGWDNISEKSQQSLSQIGKTLCGYPQLASEARYAAGQIGYVARRLLLGERLKPYIGNLDLEHFIESH